MSCCGNGRREDRIGQHGTRTGEPSGPDYPAVTGAGSFAESNRHPWNLLQVLRFQRVANEARRTVPPREMAAL